MPTKKIKVAVVGASGYVGIELVRLLSQHPHAQLKSIVSRQYQNQPVAKIFPNLRQPLKFSAPEYEKIARSVPCVFLALPHHESMGIARIFRDAGCKVIDLSADFRFTKIANYEATYGDHSEKKLAQESVYGLCEIYAQDIRKARLVGVPGCYVTSILLALAPLVQNQAIALNDIICDSKSGVSGAGRKADADLIFSEVAEDFKAYGLVGHRHEPEITEKLAQLSGKSVSLIFTPHLLPIRRGILSTIYAKPLRQWKKQKLSDLLQRFYRKSHFIRVLDDFVSPRLKSVVGTNYCDISAHYDPKTERIVILSALDNLLKGAAGQAVQCFNIMHGLKETEGLSQISLWP